MTAIIKHKIIDLSSQFNDEVYPHVIDMGVNEVWRNAELVVDQLGRYIIFAWRKNEYDDLGKVCVKISQDAGATFTSWSVVTGMADDGTDDVEESYIKVVVTPHNTIILSLTTAESSTAGVSPSNTILNIRGFTGVVGVENKYRRGDNILGLNVKPLEQDYVPGEGFTYLTKVGLYWENEGATSARVGVTYTSDFGATGIRGVTGVLGVTGIQGIQGVTGLSGGGGGGYEYDRAILASNQSIAAGVPTVVSFDTVASGNLGIWNAGTSSGVIAADDYYRICLQLRIDPGSAGVFTGATIDIDGAPVKFVLTNPSLVCEWIGYIAIGSVITATVVASVGGIILVSGTIECSITVERWS